VRRADYASNFQAETLPHDGFAAARGQPVGWPFSARSFRVEGGLVTNRMRWPLADELRRQCDVECSGPDCPDASEILDLMRDDIPLLNEARTAVRAPQG
jgi:hypothetical protein